MKKLILIILITSLNLIASDCRIDSVKVLMQQFIKSNENGLLFGFYDEDIDSLTILTVGEIKEANDLRLACPTTKSCLSYIILREGINIDTTINNWFPQKNGYTKSDSITLRMLLYNTSGIQEYIKFIGFDPDRIVTPKETVELAYKNQNLEFDPGNQYRYSNTNFSLLGLILEEIKGKDFNSIIKEYFHDISPSLRMDDGKGNYPFGYINPWPFHWSVTGYAGGLISTAEDAIKVFSHISNQTEFNIMTDWIEDRNKSNHLVGMGIFAFKNWRDMGEVIYYDGDMLANQMLLMKIKNTVYYFHTSHSDGLENLINLAYKIIRTLNN